MPAKNNKGVNLQNPGGNFLRSRESHFGFLLVKTPFMQDRLYFKKEMQKLTTTKFLLHLVNWFK